MPHKLGQVFLHDKNIIQKIYQYADVSTADHAVEIGCGDGILTSPLVDLAKQLDVVEIDPMCITKTTARLNAEQKEIPTFHQQDILRFDLSKLGKNLHIVANIPYYISAKIVKHLIDHRQSVKSATLMVQKEFAAKLLASPGDKDYTSLNVYTSYFFTVDHGFYVPKTCFKPQPKVDSSVIKLTPREEPPFELDGQEDRFFDMVRSAFWGRRKPLMSALKKSPYFETDVNLRELDFFKGRETVRGETLSLVEFGELWEQLR